MKNSRYSPEQVAFGLRQAEEGTTVADVCHKMGAGSALRGRISQAVRGAEPVGGAARRDHDTQLPSSPGKAQTGQGLVR